MRCGSQSDFSKKSDFFDKGCGSQSDFSQKSDFFDAKLGSQSDFSQKSDFFDTLFVQHLLDHYKDILKLRIISTLWLALT
jgi:hypothetical protein